MEKNNKLKYFLKCNGFAVTLRQYFVCEAVLFVMFAG